MHDYNVHINAFFYSQKIALSCSFLTESPRVRLNLCFVICVLSRHSFVVVKDSTITLQRDAVADPGIKKSDHDPIRCLQ